MSIDVGELRRMFDDIAGVGDLDGGLVLADALEELGYRGAARLLSALLRAIAPIEEEIGRRGIAETAEAHALYRPLRGPCSRVKKLVRFAFWLEDSRRSGRPFAWFNLEAGGIGPTGNRIKRGVSYPVLVRDQFHGTNVRDPMVGVEFVPGPPVEGFIWSSPRILAARRAMLSTAPRFNVAPGTAIFREIFK